MRAWSVTHSRMNSMPLATLPTDTQPNRGSFDPALLEGLCVYQDVIVEGRVLYRGQRQMQRRWEAIVPHLPRDGTLLDVGSNFGWFALRWCEHAPQGITISVEADLRSAAVQRRVLELNGAERVCLLTARAEERMARQFAARGCRFDAVLCLSVLHWVEDHEAFLQTLGPLSTRLFIEQPGVDEHGAGVESIRRAIGPLGPYLQRLFPDRPVEPIARWPSDRDARQERELWMVGPTEATESTSRISVAPLLEHDVSWPPKSWWQRQASMLLNEPHTEINFGPTGLTIHPSPGCSRFRIEQALREIPEERVSTRRRQLRRTLRAAWRRLRG